MQSAKTASEYSNAAGQAVQARDALKNIAKEELASLQEQLKSRIGIQGPMSGFSALGFSMGETLNPTAGIERQID